MGIEVTDLDKSIAFYTKALAPLGYELIMKWEQFAGFGVKGKPTGQIEVGLEFTFSNDRGEFRNDPPPTGVTPPVTPVPDTKYNRSVTKLSGKYAMQKNAGVKLQYIHDRFSTNDWTWDTWTYSDGTRVLPNSQQKVDFLGVSYYFNF